MEETEAAEEIYTFMLLRILLFLTNSAGRWKFWQKMEFPEERTEGPAETGKI
jgi:hypothetical protein